MGVKRRFLFYILIGMAGLLLGLGAFTFHYAEGFAYFSKDPRACMNCHIMKPQFDSWQKSSHHGAAVCVDCHLPHGFIQKYIAKADNGYRHSKGFTFQDFHEPIMITPGNARILQENCIRCHGPLVHNLAPVTVKASRAVACVHCHSSAGHGDVAGLGRAYKDFKKGE